MTDTAFIDWRTSSLNRRADGPRPEEHGVNAVLSFLPEHVRAAVEASSQRREVQAGEVLREAGRPLQRVHFVRSGVVSICGIAGDNRVEVASVGNEGFVGVSNILGSPVAEHTALAMSPCIVDSIDVQVLGMLTTEHPQLHQALMGYAHKRMEQVISLSVCNVRHRLEQRLARWILMAHARLGPDRIVVTHRDLAQLLGVRRASVTESMHIIEGHGAIRSHRGYLSVRDEGKLAELSCGCHRSSASRTDGA